MRAIKFTALALPLLLASAGCDNNALVNIPLTPDPVTVTETFTGSVSINGAATHTFFTTGTGAVTATLTSLGENPPEHVGLSLGTYAGSTCSLVLTNDKAVVSSVVTGTVTTLLGSLCVRIYDVGSLAGPAAYEIKVEHK